ncbi:MAG: hypothetical protein EOM20_06745 [Spartobacteria bacterium]|nr:hypothetical protein [Spartobacteria bacterium]
MSQDILNDIKDELIATMKKDEWFSNVDIISDQKGDIDTIIKKQIDGLRLLIVIEVLSGNVFEQSMGSVAIDLDISFTIEETVLLNRAPGGSGKTAGMALVRLFSVFHPYQATALLSCTLSGFETLNNTGNKLIYQVTGTAKAGWQNIKE